MKNWINNIKYYLRQFLELGVLLLAVSVFAERMLKLITILTIFDTQRLQQI